MTEVANAHGESRCRVVLRWLAVFAWACLIFFVSSRTGSNLSSDMGVFSGIYEALMAFQERWMGSHADLVNSTAHFCEYTVLGALLANALRLRLPLGLAFFVAVLCASGYGCTDEIHQLFVPTRMCDPLDWLVDTAGATLGSAIVVLVAKRKRVKSRSVHACGVKPSE